MESDSTGGFKISFSDGGLFMYHPDTGSHHGGEYYKITFGKPGDDVRYDRNGNRIEYILSDDKIE